MENRKIIYFLLFKAPVESSLQFLPVPSPIPHQKKKIRQKYKNRIKSPFLQSVSVVPWAYKNNSFLSIGS